MLQWTWVCRYLFEIVISFSLDKYSAVELLDHIVILFLMFWGTSILFSIVVAPIYIPTNSAQGFPFLQILGNTCFLFFDDSHSNRCEMISQLWFWFVFPWWLFMLNTFSCTCWPSLEKCRSSAHFLFGLFFYWVVWVLYIFWILMLYQIHDLKIFFLFSRLLFYFVGFLCCSEAF